MRTLWLTPFMILSSSAFANCVPSAEWSGKLIAPSASDRRSDGGISIQIENAPAQYSSLKGRTVHLVQKGPGATRKHDNHFGPKALEFMKKDQLILALGLDGWKSVSPLESLAHSRPNDVIRASLSEITISADLKTITTTKEPVLLDGDSRCLVQFVQVNGNEAEVRHYDAQSKSFNGPQETVKLDFKRDLPIAANQKISLAGIVNHSVNETGWDVFGHNENGTFVIESIEPYALHKVKPSDKDEARSEKFRNLKDYWKMDNSSKTHAVQTTYLPSQGQTSFKNGDRFILVHTFGSYNMEGMSLGKYRGHSGIGIAEIKTHPISGELVYDVIYKQVYGQSKQGVFAASYHGHAYTGNLYRGRSFARPMNDVLYPMNGMGPGFEARLERAFDDMATDYRVGFGHGMARVTIMTSCVHDTGNVLLSVLNSGPKNSLTSRMSRNLGRIVLPDPSFRNVELLPDDIDSKPSTLLRGRLNLNLTIPRNFQDSLVKSFVQDGQYPVVILGTFQVGDDMPELSPKAPDRIRTLIGTLIANWLKEIF